MQPRNTKEAIKRACVEMLREKTMSQITVRAIVEACGINRNSFYYHYADIPSLVSEIVMENADRLITEHAQIGSLEECLTAMAQFALAHKRELMNIYRSANRSLYEQYLARVCLSIVQTYLKTVYGDVPISSEDKEIIDRFYQCELYGQMSLWMESDMRYDIQKQFGRQCELRAGFARQMLERCRLDRERE